MNNILYVMRSFADTPVTKHFKYGEHFCKCGYCTQQKLHRNLYPMLEKLRTNLGGRPITITSGYRCPTHNAKVGGAKKSQHMNGCACDIVVSGVKSQATVAGAAIRLGFVGVKSYSGWVHVDLREGAQWHVIG